MVILIYRVCFLYYMHLHIKLVLQLSGLVVKQQGKLRIYNQIYREIFDSSWIENQLNSLHPYSENFRFWVASGGADESRLLRGKALQEAEEWARDKNLSYQDKQFLAASKETEIQEEIAAKEQEAALERERKDKEAAEGRNQLLSEANKKAQRRISVGVVVLVVAVLGAVGLGIFSSKQVEVANKAKGELKQAKEQTQEAQTSAEQAEKQESEARMQVISAQKKVEDADKNAKLAQQQAQTSQKKASRFEQDAAKARQNLSEAQKTKLKIEAEFQRIESKFKQTNTKNEKAQTEVDTVRQLVALAGQLRNQSSSASDEALRLAAVSFNIDNHELKQALLIAAKSQVYRQLNDDWWINANKEIEGIQSNLSQVDQKVLDSSQGLQVQVLAQKIQGDLLAQKNTKEAIKSYTAAFNILKDHPKETDFTKNNQLLTGDNIESIHRSLIKLDPQNKKIKKQVEQSLTQHLYTQLEYFLKAKNWEAADGETDKLMLNIAKREEQRYLSIDSINNFSCLDLRKIDKFWFNADNRFGFRVQKEIWISTGNRLGIKLNEWTDKDSDNYLRFAKAVGWYDDKREPDNQAENSRGNFVSHDELVRRIKEEGRRNSRGNFVSHDELMRRIKENSMSDKYVSLPSLNLTLPWYSKSGYIVGRVSQTLLLSRCDL
ncbi:GUN4 domain-containing protein [Nostoc linckia FACHB-391]|uniref:GUN4 domain-containing protein n=3 Tax=Nostoc TaxID=1177 RepID=A0ABR8IJI2_9NOSO|nr:GUN4 domain-containing protein [Nostoc linckia FACHB-391]MBD2651314.1 GUN4 domain-containing protein [Nostoc foliaceum FACHB-393]